MSEANLGHWQKLILAPPLDEVEGNRLEEEATHPSGQVRKERAPRQGIPRGTRRVSTLRKGRQTRLPNGEGPILRQG